MTKAVSMGKKGGNGRQNGETTVGMFIWLVRLIIKQICKSEIKLKYLSLYFSSLENLEGQVKAKTAAPNMTEAAAFYKDGKDDKINLPPT